MSEEIIAHAAYRYKPDESGEKYITCWFENGSTDVHIESKFEEFPGIENLDDLVAQMIIKLSGKAEVPIVGTLAGLNDQNPVAKPGQLVYVSDKGWIKYGDGQTTFRDLPDPRTKELDELIDKVKHGVPIAGTFDQLRNYDPEFVMGEGQMAFETDTGRIKLGDGIHTVAETKYYYIPENYAGKDASTIVNKMTLYINNLKKYLPIIDTQYSLFIRLPLLNNMQVGIESDTGRVRVGDGTTPWDQLPYIDPTTEQGLIDAIDTLTRLASDLSPIYKLRAEWDEQNPYLEEGRLGIETDTKLAKLGDGNTIWELLPYLSTNAELTTEEIQKVLTLLTTMVPLVGTTEFLSGFDEDIPPKGKIIRDTTLSKYKVGDGFTKLMDLPWLNTIDPSSGEDLEIDADESRVQMHATGDMGEDVDTNTERIEGVPEGGTPDPNDDVYFAVQGEVNDNA